MTRKAWRNGVVSFLVFFGICTAAAAAQAPATGILQGRVVDATSGDPLPGATVLIEGTTMAATTDRSGTFRFAAAPRRRRPAST